MGIPYEELGFSDDFMFGKIMSDPDICKEFLSRILSLDIHHVVYVDRQKSLKDTVDGKGIRLDIYVDDGTTVYNCEMQTAERGDLAKRARFYQSEIDMSLIGQGEEYSALRQSYVIFICTFDPFADTPEAGNAYYVFENRMLGESGNMLLGDGTKKVFLNTKGSLRPGFSPDISELLQFIDKSEDREYSDPLCSKLLQHLKTARKNKDWRREQLTFEMKLRDARADGHAEGREEGEGRMISLLLSDGKTPEEVAQMLKMSVAEVRKLEKVYLDSLVNG